MKNEKLNTQNIETKDRRALLKGLVAGSAVVTGSRALPETWTKPLTDSVILPGHAITTVGDWVKGDYGDYEGNTGDTDGSNATPDGYSSGSVYVDGTDIENDYTSPTNSGDHDDDVSDAPADYTNDEGATSGDYSYGDTAEDGISYSESNPDLSGDNSGDSQGF